MLVEQKKMKSIQFIGTRNKSDFVMYLAHVLKNLDKRVLVVDSTTNEWYRNGFARLNEGQFLFDFQGVDILTGTTNWLDVEECLLRAGETTIAYDVILIDIDSVEAVNQEWPTFTERFYVGDYDRAHQLLDTHMIKELIATTGNNELKRITFEASYQMDQTFFEELLESDVQWRSMNYIFQSDELIEGLHLLMQHEQVIPYKRLNKQYKELLSEIVSGLYEMHVKDISDAVKTPFFKLPFKRKHEIELEGSNA